MLYLNVCIIPFLPVVLYLRYNFIGTARQSRTQTPPLTTGHLFLFIDVIIDIHLKTFSFFL